MGTTRDQTISLASSPFIGQVDDVVERVATDFGAGVDTIVADMVIVFGKPTVDSVGY